MSNEGLIDNISDENFHEYNLSQDCKEFQATA